MLKAYCVPSDLSFLDRTGSRQRSLSIARTSIAFTLALAGLLLAAQAAASGRMGPLPVSPHTFDSFSACNAHLEKMHAEHMHGLGDGPISLDSETTREKMVQTKGVIQVGTRRAKYQAVVGYEVRVTNNAEGFIKTDFFYDEVDLACTGRTLSGTTTSGYYLPGFEDITKDKN